MAAGDESPGDVAIGTVHDAAGPGDSYVVTLDSGVRVRDVVARDAVVDNLTGPAFRGAVV